MSAEKYTGNSSNEVSRLGTAAGHVLGPNVLLKVMGGDRISTRVKYLAPMQTNQPAGNNAQTIIGGLINTISNGATASASVKNQWAPIRQELYDNNGLNGLLAPTYDPHENPRPQAYLTILYFDERFMYVGENSQTVQIAQTGTHGLLEINASEAPRNGYAYVFISNSSQESVYFDDFWVQQQHSAILEENHYYAYGLRIAGISSRKLADPHEGMVQNNNLYNGKELDEEGDLGWYNYGFRYYDPQIGRFPQLDPLTWDYPELTNYQYASCDPILNIDLDGLEGSVSILPEIFISSVRRSPHVFLKTMNTINITVQTVRVATNVYIYQNCSPTGDVCAEYTTKQYEGKYIKDKNLNYEFAGTGVSESYNSIPIRGGLNITSSDGQWLGPPYATDPRGSVNFDDLFNIAGLASNSNSVGEIPTNTVDATKEAIDKTHEAGKIPEKTPNPKFEKKLTWWDSVPNKSVVNFGTTNSEKINDTLWKPTLKDAKDTSPTWKSGFKLR